MSDADETKIRLEAQFVERKGRLERRETRPEAALRIECAREER